MPGRGVDEKSDCTDDLRGIGFDLARAGYPRRVGSLKRLLTRWKGRIVEPWSDAAGDRRSEAKARIEANTGHVPDDRELERVEHKVKVEHGDVDPRMSRPRNSPPPGASRR